MPQTALITGCSSGIGRETALLFHEKSWNVSATMRSPEKESQLRQLSRVEVFKLDVTDPSTVEGAVKASVEAFGGIDVAINNAGYGIFGPFEGTTREQIQRLFQTNLFGLFDVTRCVLPYLRQSSRPVLVNISSMAGLYSLPFIAPYASTKFAVEGFTECLFYELEPLGIRVKLIEPGNVETKFVWEPASGARVDEPVASRYARKLEKVLDFWNQPGKRDGRASVRAVAETIYRAVTDGSRQIRYIVGDDAKDLWETRSKLGAQGYVESLLRQVL